MDNHTQSLPEGTTAQEWQEMCEDEMRSDFEPAVWEHNNEPCPDCGSFQLYTMPRMCSPDDYVRQTECRACGSTWED